MRRVFSVLLVVILAISLISCSEKEPVKMSDKMQLAYDLFTPNKELGFELKDVAGKDAAEDIQAFRRLHKDAYVTVHDVAENNNEVLLDLNVNTTRMLIVVSYNNAGTIKKIKRMT